MNSRAGLGIAIISVLAGLAMGVLVGWYVVSHTESEGASAKTVTVRELTEISHEPTVFHHTHPVREVTRWKTTGTTLPDTGPALRRHKAH